MIDIINQFIQNKINTKWSVKYNFNRDKIIEKLIWNYKTIIQFNQRKSLVHWSTVKSDNKNTVEPGVTNELGDNKVIRYSQVRYIHF